MGRKRIPIDASAVEKAAADGLTEAEVAARLGISLSTLARRKRDFDIFDTAIKRGRAKADAEVSSQLFSKVREGMLGAIIWYEKTRKKYSDRVETDNTTRHEFPQFEEAISKIYGNTDGDSDAGGAGGDAGDTPSATDTAGTPDAH